MAVRHLARFDPAALEDALGDSSVSALLLDLGHGADTIDPALGPLLRRMETGGKPVAALLRGRVADTALAVALACHRRFATEHTVIAGAAGFPGAGVIQRLLRLAGYPATLALLLEGRALDAAAAREAGLIDVVGAGDLVALATAWAETATVIQPWDTKGFRMPGPDLMRGPGASAFTAAIAVINGRGAEPHAVAVLQAIHDGFAVPIDTALRHERPLA